MAIYTFGLKFKKIIAFGSLLILISAPGSLFGQYIVSESIVLKSTIAQTDTSVHHAHGLLGFYKRFISSQDGPSCIFTPSCSVYAYNVLKNKGLVMGWLSASDRLLRCYGHTDEFYPTDDRDFFIDH